MDRSAYRWPLPLVLPGMARYFTATVLLWPSTGPLSSEVPGADPHGFDGDNDGIGCET